MPLNRLLRLGLASLILIPLWGVMEASASNDRKPSLGRERFVQRCAACHGQNGRGGMGPDLRPIAAGNPASLRAIIEQGRKTKGMPSYKGQFSEEEWRELLAHLAHLK